MNTERAKQVVAAIKKLASGNAQLSINELRVVVALERAIARIERHPELAEHLVFKGGFVLLKMFDSTRFTRDADALATGISKEVLKKLVSESLANDLEDGLWFGDLQVQEIPEQDKYGAYRFDCAFQIGEPELNKVHKFSRVHIDVGFSDKLPVKPELETMPSVLKHEEPVSWKVYPIEFMVAEKLETLFDRGSANSRAKDIYDLVHLFPKCKTRRSSHKLFGARLITDAHPFPHLLPLQPSSLIKRFLQTHGRV